MPLWFLKGGRPASYRPGLRMDERTGRIYRVKANGDEVEVAPDSSPGAQALASVLAEGNDADGLPIENLGDPTNDQDAATKKYVDDNAGDGGSQPYLDRAPAGDVTVPDKGCIVSIDYYEPTGTLTLDGDAVLEILT